jgi:hypothetical protein
MNGTDDNADALDISRSGPLSGNPIKSTLLTGLDTPLDGHGDGADDDSFLTRLQERFEDTRDALMESEPFAQAYASAVKVVKAGKTVFVFSKQAVWVLGTSALVLVVPLLYEMDKEMNAVAISDSAAAGDSVPVAESSGTESP